MLMTQSFTHARPATVKPGSDPLLKIEGVSCKAGMTFILRNIAAELDRGEVVALLGPNGAGKTTLLKCVAGLIPFSGSILIDGKLLRRDPATRSKVAFLGHETFLYPKLTARENLNFFQSLYKSNSDVDRLLNEMDLTRAAEQAVETFSRGMKQRLSLARCFMTSPELLLMDEPFTGLDRQGAEILQQSLGRVTTLFTTHDISSAEKTASRFIILKNGKVAWTGTRTDLLSKDLESVYRTALQ